MLRPMCSRYFFGDHYLLNCPKLNVRTMHVASFWLRGIVQRCQLRCDDSIDSNGSDRKAFEIKGSDGIDSKSSDNQVP